MVYFLTQLFQNKMPISLLTALFNVSSTNYN